MGPMRLSPTVHTNLVWLLTHLQQKGDIHFLLCYKQNSVNSESGSVRARFNCTYTNLVWLSTHLQRKGDIHFWLCCRQNSVDSGSSLEPGSTVHTNLVWLSQLTFNGKETFGFGFAEFIFGGASVDALVVLFHANNLQSGHAVVIILAKSESHRKWRPVLQPRDLKERRKTNDAGSQYIVADGWAGAHPTPSLTPTPSTQPPFNMLT